MRNQKRCRERVVRKAMILQEQEEKTEQRQNCCLKLTTADLALNFIVSFIHPYEPMLCFNVLNQTRSSRPVKFLVPPPVCHMKMKASYLVPYPKTQQVDSLGFSSCPFRAEHQTGSYKYHFFKVFWFDSTRELNIRLSTAKRMLYVLKHHSGFWLMAE